MKKGLILKSNLYMIYFFKNNVKSHFYCPAIIKLVIIFYLGTEYIYTRSQQSHSVCESV